MTEEPNTTTTEYSTNGRVRVERAIQEPRNAIESRTRRGGFRRLILPAMIIAGAAFVVLRRDRAEA